MRNEEIAVANLAGVLLTVGTAVNMADGSDLHDRRCIWKTNTSSGANALPIPGSGAIESNATGPTMAGRGLPGPGEVRAFAGEGSGLVLTKGVSVINNCGVIRTAPFNAMFIRDPIGGASGSGVSTRTQLRRNEPAGRPFRSSTAMRTGLNIPANQRTGRSGRWKGR